MGIDKLKILAIDDNPDNLITIKAVIKDVLPIAEVFTALDGKKGIQIARDEDPDVILLDILMPEMDGFEVCRFIKKDKDLSIIPVLFLTALKTERNIRIKALEAGGEAFLSKPIDETELLVQVQVMAKIKSRNILLINEKIRLEALVSERTKIISDELSMRKRAEKELRLSEERYKSIFNQSPLGIALADSISGEICEVNKKFTEILDLTADEILKIDWMSITHPDDIDEDLKMMSLLRDKKIRSFNLNKRYIKPDLAEVWVNMTVASILNDGIQPYHLCMVEDITDKKEKEQKIAYLSYHDSLTGIFNRGFYEEEVIRYDTERQLPLSIIIGDINGLKLINDTLGHAEGDRLLVKMAEILKKCSRKEDILARVGGDEFSILLPRTTGDEAQAILERIYSLCFDNEDNQSVDKVFLSISLGHATKNNMFELFDNIEKIAEDNMYKRKLLEHKSFHSSLINSMRVTMYEKSHETEQHAIRLVDLSKKIAKTLGLKEEQLNELELLAMLHDIGKISINDNILTKPDKLNDEEWREMRKHPEIGYRIAMASPELEPIAEYILCHHERWDGKGYPQGIVGENIPLLSRILSVTDAYDAMTEDRPYRKAISVDKALEEISKNCGTQFDPNLGKLFIKIISE